MGERGGGEGGVVDMGVVGNRVESRVGRCPLVRGLGGDLVGKWRVN